MNQPIKRMTSTPAMNSPNTPSVLTCWSFGWLFVEVGDGTVGVGAGVVRAGGSGLNGLPGLLGAGAGLGAGAAVCAPASGAATRSVTSAARAGRPRIGATREAFRRG